MMKELRARPLAGSDRDVGIMCEYSSLIKPKPEEFSMEKIERLVMTPQQLIDHGYPTSSHFEEPQPEISIKKTCKRCTNVCILKF